MDAGILFCFVFFLFFFLIFDLFCLYYLTQPSGKSTIMGHLLYLIGDVSNKELHRFKGSSPSLPLSPLFSPSFLLVDSENMGKGSFHFAWVLDQNAEERERGVTMVLILVLLFLLSLISFLFLFFFFFSLFLSFFLSPIFLPSLLIAPSYLFRISLSIISTQSTKK